MRADPKIKRKAIVGTVVSVFTLLILIAYLFLVIHGLTAAFPGQSLLNPGIYNSAGVGLSVIIVMLISALSTAGFGAGLASLRRSRAQGSRPLLLALVGFSIGMLNQVLLFLLLGFHAYLLTLFAAS